MDFFTHQDQARKRTSQLVMLFVAAVICLVVLLNMLVATLLWFTDTKLIGTYTDVTELAFDPSTGLPQQPGLFAYMNVEQWLIISAAVVAVIVIASLVKWLMLRGGGRKVAESLGGRLLLPNSKDFYERRLLNVVEEMAIASGMPVPPVYVLEDESINAFAAGYQPSDAVIGVTRGCMTQLSRDQLQGVLAHEFSHIFNGDMRLNIRLMALLFGILFIGIIGRFLLESSSRSMHYRSSNSKNNSGAAMLGLGLGLVVIGYGGVFFGNLIKAAVSRQREFLADASAVQFTRNPDSIGGALKVIGYGAGSEISSPEREETAHLFFGQALPFRVSWFATHPPLEERIRRVDPRWDGRYLPPQSRDAAGQEVPDVAARSAGAGLSQEALAGGIAAGVAGISMAHSGDSASQPAAAEPAIAADSAQNLPRLQDAARDAYSARALVFALLMAEPSRFVHGQQLDMIRSQQGMDFYQQTLRILPLLNGLNPAERLPLVELSMPALKQLSASQFQDFRQTLVQLAKADGEIDIFEWCLYRLVLQYLNPQFEPVQPVAAKHAKADALSTELALVLSMLAHYGHDTHEAASQAFSSAIAAAGFGGLSMQPRSASLKPLNQALAKLREAYPHIKGRLVKAMQVCINSDGQQRAVELDLVRTMAAILEVPVVL